MSDINELIVQLKDMGLGQVERAKVLETYRDAGRAEALEQAKQYVTQRNAQIGAAKKAARDLCGLDI